MHSEKQEQKLKMNLSVRNSFVAAYEGLPLIDISCTYFIQIEKEQIHRFIKHLMNIEVQILALEMVSSDRSLIDFVCKY